MYTLQVSNSNAYKEIALSLQIIVFLILYTRLPGPTDHDYSQTFSVSVDAE